jgi:hypothetical protein
MDSELDNHIEQIEDDSSKANDTIQKHLSRVSQLITNQSKRNVARWRKNLLKTKRKTLLENKTLLKRVEALETELSKTNQELTKVKEKRDEDQKKHSKNTAYSMKGKVNLFADIFFFVNQASTVGN